MMHALCLTGHELLGPCGLLEAVGIMLFHPPGRMCNLNIQKTCSVVMWGLEHGSNSASQHL